MAAAWIALLSCAVAWSHAAAQATAQPSLRVLLNAPAASGLLERVLGQVSDLPVVILAVPEADVRVEVGAVPLSPVGWRIESRDHRRDTRETREVISDDAHPLTQSAADEAAALVIRSLLQAILRADQDALASSVPETRMVAVAPVVAPVVDPVQAAAEPSDEPAPGLLLLTAGAQLSMVTIDGDVASALWGRVGLRAGRFALGVEGRYGLAIAVRDSVASTEIAAHALMLSARADVLTWRGGAFAVTSAVGSHLWSRRDTRVLAGWEATNGTRLWSPSLGMGAEVRVVLLDALALGLGLGFDLLSRRPTLDRVALDGRVSTLATLSWFVPRAALGIELSL